MPLNSTVDLSTTFKKAETMFLMKKPSRMTLPGCDIIYIPTTIHVLIIPSHIQRKDKNIILHVQRNMPERKINKRFP